MSLEKLTAAQRTDILPGYRLSPARLSDFAQLENEFARQHLAVAGQAGVGLPAPIAKTLIAAASADIASGAFRYGRSAFDTCISSVSSLPILLHVLIVKEKPSMTREEAARLMDDVAADQYQVFNEVLKLFGYDLSKEGRQNPNRVAAQSGNGPQSSPPSEPVDSPTPTLQL